MFSDLANKKILYINDRHEEKDVEQEDRCKLYDKRILPLLNRDDLAIFGEEIDPFLWDYYRSLGLANIDNNNVFYIRDYLEYPSLTKAVLGSHLILETIRERKPDVLMPYIVSKDTQTLAQRLGTRILGSFESVEYFSNKANYRNVIKRLGFPMINGFRVRNLEEAKKYFSLLKIEGFKKIVIKKERSVAGFGIFVVRTEKELSDCFRRNFTKQQSFLLEGFIEDIVFCPNIQYWIGPKIIKRVSLSDQLFEKNTFVHKGNAFPSRLNEMSHILGKIYKLSLKLCHYMQSHNYRGLVGIDYLVTKNNDIYSTEINCRLNYSTFPALITERLFGLEYNLSWETFTIKGCPVSFEALFKNARDVFITKKGEFGILPIDIGILKSKGEGQFMTIAPTARSVERYKNKLLYIYENLS